MSETLLPEDQEISFAQDMRKRLVNDMIKDGKFPEDPKEKTILLHALADMDRSSLGRKRITGDKAGVAAQAASVALIAEMLRDPRAARVGQADGIRTQAPRLPDTIQPERVLPGELTSTPSSETYTSFTQRMNGAAA